FGRTQYILTHTNQRCACWTPQTAIPVRLLFGRASKPRPWPIVCKLPYVETVLHRSRRSSRAVCCPASINQKTSKRLISESVDHRQQTLRPVERPKISVPLAQMCHRNFDVPLATGTMCHLEF